MEIENKIVKEIAVPETIITKKGREHDVFEKMNEIAKATLSVLLAMGKYEGWSMEECLEVAIYNFAGITLACQKMAKEAKEKEENK